MVFLDSVPSVHELGDLIGTTTMLCKMLIPILYKIPGTKKADELHELLKPFLLRRTKNEVRLGSFFN